MFRTMLRTMFRTDLFRTVLGNNIGDDDDDDLVDLGPDGEDESPHAIAYMDMQNG